MKQNWIKSKAETMLANRVILPKEKSLLARIRVRSKDAALVTVLVLLAFGLRFWGSNFGLPYEYHVDEDQYVRQAATMGETGLKPADWYNPPLFKYLLLGEYGAFYLLGRATGVFSSTADFGARMSVDPSWLYLLGRWTSALFSALTVFLTYWTGKRAYNNTVGLLAAFLLAVTFLPVREAHFAVNDALAGFWVALALLAAVWILKTGQARGYLLAGAALGFGFATKYHVLAAGLPVLIGHFASPGVSLRRPALSKLGIVLIVMLATALIASPYFLLAPGEVWKDLYRLVWTGKYGYEGWLIDPAGGFIFYLKTFLWGLGWPLAVLCLAGLIAALVRHKAIDFLLISLPLFLYFYLGRQTMFFGRFMLPAIPPLLIIAAVLLYGVAARFFHSQPMRRRVLLITSLLLVLLPVISVLRFDTLLGRTDTRTLAKDWMEKNIPDRSRVAMEWLFHCPPVSSAERPTANSSRTYQVWVAELVLGKGISDHSLDWYRENSYHYLVACSSIYRLPLADPVKDQERQKFYASLDRQATLLTEFKPNSQGEESPFIFDEIYGPAISLWQRERPGPTIKIYQLKP